MRMNLPKEMDFVHEASNAARAAQDFENIKTSLHIPTVISATKRVLIMEYIQGGRVDDLEYLAQHKIDRNKVALELARIFNQMVFINGWFHAVRTTIIVISIWSDIGCRIHIQVFLFIIVNHKQTTLTSSQGNLLIRPASSTSKSPYNFEIALLDHGLYFDLVCSDHFDLLYLLA
jgi:aarF domain-containing kinase